MNPLLLAGMFSAVAFLFGRRREPTPAPSATATTPTSAPLPPAPPAPVGDPLAAIALQGTRVSPIAQPIASTPATTPTSSTPVTTPTSSTPTSSTPTSSTPTSSTPTSSTDRAAAAQGLWSYILGGGRNIEVIGGYQRRLGLFDDGIVGPQTRGAVARELATTGNTAGNVTQRQNAYSLQLYRAMGGNDRTTLREYQAGMGNIPVDGLWGPQTEARMRVLLA